MGKYKVVFNKVFFVIYCHAFILLCVYQIKIASKEVTEELETIWKVSGCCLAQHSGVEEPPFLCHGIELIFDIHLWKE